MSNTLYMVVIIVLYLWVAVGGAGKHGVEENGE